jgi:NADH-quinone oxidoreductase subunit F
MNLEEIKRKNQASREGRRILVGMSSCGIAAGAKEVYEKLEHEIKERNLPVAIDITGCTGYCYSEPTINIFKGQESYLLGPIHPDDVVTILETFIIHDGHASKYLIPHNYENVTLE